MNKFMLYLKESYHELTHEVSWPTVAQLQESTMVVLATTAILALIIFTMDAVNSVAFKMLYGI